VVAPGSAGFVNEILSAQFAQVVSGLAGGVVGLPGYCVDLGGQVGAGEASGYGGQGECGGQGGADPGLVQVGAPSRNGLTCGWSGRAWSSFATVRSPCWVVPIPATGPMWPCSLRWPGELVARNRALAAADAELTVVRADCSIRRRAELGGESGLPVVRQPAAPSTLPAWSPLLVKSPWSDSSG
jgi:hypothetical protein